MIPEDGLHRPDSESWHLKAAVSLLGTDRPTREILGDILVQLTAGCGAGHGHLSVTLGGRGDPPLQVGRGIWEQGAPVDLDAMVRRGEPIALDAAPWGAKGTVVAQPVSIADRSIGSLGVVVPTAAGAAAEHLAGLVEVFAEIVAVACTHASALEAERAALEQEQGLIRAGQVVTSTLKVDEVLPAILKELRRVVPYDTASVQELRGDQAVIVAGVGIDWTTFGGMGFAITGSANPNAEVVRRVEPVIIDDIQGDHPYQDFPAVEHEMSGVRGWMGVPLVLGNECLGMFTLDSYQVDFYTEEHARLAQSFAIYAAIALSNASAFAQTQHEVETRREAEERLRAANEALQQRMAEIEELQEHLREQTVRDPLTGLFNRRYLGETLRREARRCTRSGESISLAIVDVDHFKSVNDALGHEAGDRVLGEVALLLTGQVRDEDAVCRYGGDEFVVLLPGVPPEVARQRAEVWREAVSALELSNALGGRGITISVGVAAMPDHAETDEDLIRRADAAMYEAKRAGRDRVVEAV
ncbi:MAG: sensor domain-containing diguanylate cyclase [Acidimicrobiales bacterium]|nr:sensor domain-containing diguanylate cyclase [Acidimicrobiales bacterium]